MDDMVKDARNGGRIGEDRIIIGVDGVSIRRQRLLAKLTL